MVLTILASLAMVNMPVQAPSSVRIYVDMPVDGFIPGELVGDMVVVDLYIETPPEWYDTADGIVAWAISVKVDHTVLEPMGVIGAKADYFLYDYVTYLDPPGFTYSTGILPPVIDKTAGTIEWITEGIIPDPPTGAGDSGKLVRRLLLDHRRSSPHRRGRGRRPLLLAAGCAYGNPEHRH